MLAKYSIEQGLLTPLMRVCLTAIFAAALFAAGMFLDYKKINRRISSVLIGAGLAVFYGDCFMAAEYYALLPKYAGLCGMVACVVASFVLAKRFGVAIAYFGMLGGFLAPALVASDNPSTLMLFAYLLLMTLGSLQTFVKNNDIFGYFLSMFMNFIWIGAWFFFFDDPSELHWTFLYFAAISPTFYYYGGKLDLNSEFFTDSFSAEMRFFCARSLPLAFCTAVSYYGTLDFLSSNEPVWYVAAFLPLFVAGMLALGVKDIVTRYLTLLFPLMVVSYANEARCISGLLESFNFAFILFSFLGIFKLKDKLYSAIFFGLTLIIFSLASDTNFALNITREYHALLVALLVSLSFFAYYVSYKKEVGKLPLFIFALTASAILMLFPFIHFRSMEYFLPIYFPAVLLVFSMLACFLFEKDWIYAMSPFTCFFFILACMWGGLSILLMTGERPDFFGDFFKYFFNTWQGWAGLALIFASVVLIGKKMPDARVTTYILLFSFLLGLLVQSGAGFFACAKAGGYLSSNLAFLIFFGASAIVFFIGRLLENPHFKIAGIVGVFYALIKFVFVNLTAANPMLLPIYINGLPVFDSFMVSALIPAAAMALIARSCDSKYEKMKIFATICAIILFFTYINFEMRFWFQGNMMNGSAGDLEFYMYSPLWLAYGIFLLGLGFMRRDKLLRCASLVFALLAVLKVFLFDAASLDGLLRVLSFTLLGLSLVGIGWFYARFVFRKAD